MSDGKKTIYIAGPMRGIKYFNFPAFDQAEKHLEEQGWDVISPAKLDRQTGFDPEILGSDYDWRDLHSISFDLKEAVRRDVDAILKSQAIYMLEGWQNSKGATSEKTVAEWLGLEVIYQKQENVLLEADRITSGDRQASYGPPDQDFARTAKMWSALKGVEFEAREVALFMIALKLSRETHQCKRDNWVDIAGYAKCGSICRRLPSE